MADGVMLVVDNPHRELRGLYCIATRLRERRIPVRIVSKIGYQDAFELYRPRVVVLPRITSDMARFARKAAHHALITVIPSEHGSGFREKVVLNSLGILPNGGQEADAAPETVTRIYVGGSNQRDWLLETGAYYTQQMVVSGTLNSDHWLLSPKRPPQTNRVGIATTFKSLLMTTKFASIPHLLDSHRATDWRKTSWRLAQINFELGYLLVLLDAMQKLSDLKLSVSVRPHPHEYAKGWSDCVRQFGRGFELDRSIRLDKWLRSVMFTVSSYSTVILDSIAHGVPAISLERLVPEAYEAQLASHKKPFRPGFCWCPETNEEMVELFRKGADGKLDPSPCPGEVADFMLKNFNYPRECSAADMIASDLGELCQTFGRIDYTATTVHPTYSEPLPYVRPHPLRLAMLVARRITRDFLTVLRSPRRGNLYFPFSFRLRKDARAFARDLVCVRGQRPSILRTKGASGS